MRKACHALGRKITGYKPTITFDRRRRVIHPWVCPFDQVSRAMENCPPHCLAKNVTGQLSYHAWGGAAESVRWRLWQGRSACAQSTRLHQRWRSVIGWAAREGTDPRRLRRQGMASQARDPSTVGARGIGIGRTAAARPDLRCFHSRCTDCAMGRL
ncbi:hypothetical protein M2175_001295 [Bradyrhizobium elkanii]|nr:hypothetical protein [Bradyrhizobium elkanii]MCS3966817.1 hypothetical protein [Bradyrhizobium japonicum]